MRVSRSETSGLSPHFTEKRLFTEQHESSSKHFRTAPYLTAGLSHATFHANCSHTDTVTPLSYMYTELFTRAPYFAHSQGWRKRFAEAQAARDVDEGQSRSSSHRSGCIRRRVAGSGAGYCAKNPLIDTLKLKWGKGKVSAKDVEGVIGGATAQGASQLPTLSSPAHPQNFQRSLKAALGYLGAPRFTWARILTTTVRQVSSTALSS